ncbi:MAG: simple sugar transport system permease protein [Actinomycetota bacterium]|nr:simple sugar transport system permease protein [Actinomycetota bacterium]
MSVTTAAPERQQDERVAKVGFLRSLLVKPELGSLLGAIVVFAFFATQSSVFWHASGVANWLDPASTYGIMAVVVALLMIGGHFDLSAGVQLGTAGLTTAILTTEYNMVIWVAMAISLALCLAIGFLNGYLVVRTGLPSFIITLSTFLMLQGLNLGLTKVITNTVSVGGIDQEPYFNGPQSLLASQVTLFGQKFYIAILWWVLFTVAASYLLLRTRFGNWIFAVGGDETASRNVGVPANRTTITLFMLVSFGSWFVGNIYLFRLTSIQANTGFGFELIYIAAAVIGGCLLTGGYGSAVGASVGALIIGMTSQGIVYAGWESDWFKFFLGAMLLLAVLTNQVVRKYAEQSRR